MAFFYVILIILLLSFKSAAVRNEPFVGGPGTRNVQQQGQQPLIAPAVTVAPGKVAEGKIKFTGSKLLRGSIDCLFFFGGG